MDDLRRREMLVADGLLLLTTLIWGSAFAVVKTSLDVFAPAQLVFCRYAIASLAGAVLFWPHLRHVGLREVMQGAEVGLVLGMAYLVQTMGLKETTAGKNAFLTTVYVLAVPMLGALFLREKIRRRTWMAACLMLAGIGALSLDGESGGLTRGDLLTLLSGLFFALHIIEVDRRQKTMDKYALIELQFIFCCLTALLWHLLLERGAPPLRLERGPVMGLLYLSIFSTLGGMSMQNIGQSMTPASHASIILSLESVFGVAFSCLLLGERPTVMMFIGFALIFIAQLFNQLDSAEIKERGQAEA